MKLKELLNNEKFLSKYGDYEIVGDSYTTVLQDGKSQLVFDVQKPEPKSVWELENGDRYFVLYTDGDMADYEWKRDGGISKGYRDQGNVFRTKEEAEKDVERRKVETLLIKHGGRRWFNGYNHNFHIGLDEYEEHLKAYILMTPTQGTIYFDTEKQARQAVKDIGEERLKKALFEVR